MSASRRSSTGNPNPQIHQKSSEFYRENETEAGEQENEAISNITSHETKVWGQSSESGAALTMANEVEGRKKKRSNETPPKILCVGIAY